MTVPKKSALVNQRKKKRNINQRNARDVILLHDNAHVHICGVSKATIKKCGFELIQRGVYSPVRVFFIITCFKISEKISKENVIMIDEVMD